MAEEFKDQQFIEYLVKSIVNHPEDVRTERTVDERGVLITLFINQQDMGYVIGRQGHTAQALRTLLKTVGAKQNARVNLKIYEPEGARKTHYNDESKASESGEKKETVVTDEDLEGLGI